MNSVIICNTGADSLSRIIFNDLTLEKIEFDLGEKPIGPHGIKKYSDGFITANNYSDSISFFDKLTLKEMKNVKIGPSPNDLIFYKDKVYTICGESNSIVVYDVIDDKATCEIKVGNWPHSIECNEKKGVAFITNLESNTLTIIDMNNNGVVTTIDTPEYPTKVLLSRDYNYLYVCESYLGEDKNGYLDILSARDFKRIDRVEVGSSPIDIFEGDENLYVSNFTDGSISRINKRNFQVEKSIYVGGMPKGIIMHDKKLYVADYLKGKVYIIENDSIKKVIAIESEPNAMTLF